MSFEPRSRYEYGDPLLEAVAREERHDHALAPARGARVEQIATAVVAALHTRGILTYPEVAQALTFDVLANWLYGNAALDIPTRRKDDPSCPTT
jgi:hypothetical protein